MKNIVLIGMPGSGKTSVGALVAERLGMVLLDTDAMVEAAEGMSIPVLFERRGEQYFRAAEHAAARTAAAAQNAVISTGGGMILRPDNMRLLGAAGLICFLDRPPEHIVGDDHMGRPLIGMNSNKVFSLYTQRLPLYRKYAQVIIDGSGTVEETARALLGILEGDL